MTSISSTRCLLVVCRKVIDPLWPNQRHAASHQEQSELDSTLESEVTNSLIILG